MGIEMEKNAYEAKKTEKPIWENDEEEVSLKSVNKSVEIPEDLICPVCKDLLKVSEYNQILYSEYLYNETFIFLRNTLSIIL